MASTRQRIAAALVLITIALVGVLGWRAWQGSDSNRARQTLSDLTTMPGVDRAVLDGKKGPDATVGLNSSATVEQVTAVLDRVHTDIGGDRLDDVTVTMGAARMELPFESSVPRSSAAEVLSAMSQLDEGQVLVWRNDRAVADVPVERALPVARKMVQLLKAHDIDGVDVGSGGTSVDGQVKVFHMVDPDDAMALLDPLMPFASRTPKVQIGQYSVRVALPRGTRHDAASVLAAAQKGIRSVRSGSDERSASVDVGGDHGVDLDGPGDPWHAVAVLDDLERRGVVVSRADADLGDLSVGGATAEGGAAALARISSVLAATPGVPRDATIRMDWARGSFAGTRADLARLAGPMASAEKRGYGVVWELKASRRTAVEVGIALPAGQTLDDTSATSAARVLRRLGWTGTAKVVVATVPSAGEEAEQPASVQLESTATGRAGAVTTKGYRVADAETRKAFVDAWNSTATEK